jgi:hypothetical protein
MVDENEANVVPANRHHFQAHPDVRMITSNGTFSRASRTAGNASVGSCPQNVTNILIIEGLTPRWKSPTLQAERVTKCGIFSGG